MKKIIILILFCLNFSMNSNAQNLDTVLVRSLTMQAGDWAWLVGSVPSANLRDSTTAAIVRKIRTDVKLINPSTWQTPVTIDSLPGFVVLWFFNTTKNAPAGEIASRYTAITTAISAQPNLAYWIGVTDANLNRNYEDRRKDGKSILIDD